MMIEACVQDNTELEVLSCRKGIAHGGRWRLKKTILNLMHSAMGIQCSYINRGVMWIVPFTATNYLTIMCCNAAVSCSLLNMYIPDTNKIARADLCTNASDMVVIENYINAALRCFMHEFIRHDLPLFTDWINQYWLAGRKGPIPQCQDYVTFFCPPYGYHLS